MGEGVLEGVIITDGEAESEAPVLMELVGETDIVGVTVDDGVAVDAGVGGTHNTSAALPVAPGVETAATAVTAKLADVTG